jgi:SCP-2 sterol transfer family
VPRFLSSGWVDAFNAALRHVDLTAEAAADGPKPSIATADGRYRIAQVVLDPPGDLGAGSGPVRTVLGVDGGQVTMTLGEDEADVVVVLSYADASALSRAELDPVKALSAGRIRVRGDLSVLVAGQAVLAAAGSALAGLQADTTY